MAEVRTTTTAAPQPWGETLSRRRIAAVIVSVMLGMLLSAVDQTVVGTAMPRIISDLNGLSHYAWVATAYLLASTASMPIWGKLSDAFGRKRFFILGMAIFMGGSALCGQANGMTELIAFRALQGLGAGAMMPISQAISDIFVLATIVGVAGLIVVLFLREDPLRCTHAMDPESGEIESEAGPEADAQPEPAA